MAHEVEIRPTPLHTRTAAANRYNEWRQWAGFTYPARCGGLAAECNAVQETVGLADVSPLAKYRVSGPESAAYLSRLTTRDFEMAPEPRVTQALWCDDRGAARGIAHVLRLAETEFLIVSETRDLPWLLDAKYGFDVDVEDVSEQLAGIALVGPAANTVARAAGLEAAARLAAGETGRGEARGVTLIAARREGGLRIEIFVPPEDAVPVWDWLERAGRPSGLLPVGFDALDLLRIESGEPAPMRDFVPAHLTDNDAFSVTPFALGLGRLLDLDRAHFNGRRALLPLKNVAPRRELRRLVVEGQGDSAHAPVRVGPREAGFTVSAAWSPRLSATAALAWLEPAVLDLKDRLAVLQTRREGLRRVDRYVGARLA
ncbi:MAG: aminomethyl transferase family protein [Alphaproteobacteria bacterium]|nr:aminomethyl transferase family protein [Alphaproteobacteria bacterium]